MNTDVSAQFREHGVGRRIDKFTAVLLAILFGPPTALCALLLVVWGLSFVDPVPYQDRCSFNSVSNAEYRRLLAQAKAQDWTVWPGLSNGPFSPTDRGPFSKPSVEWFLFGEADTQEFEARVGRHFKRSIEQLRFDHGSPDAQLAAAHAVMRSIRAEYVRVLEVPGYVLADRSYPTTVKFTYFIPQIRFAPLCARCLIFQSTTLGIFFRRDGTEVLADVGVLNSDLKYSPSKEEPSGPCPAFPSRKTSS